MTARHVIRILTPVVEGQTVTFAWSVTPASPLYRTTRFDLIFPEEIELGLIPAGVWWRIALTCLHPQWALLRPCRVILPVRLAPGEAETWMRLCDAHVATLEAHAGREDLARGVELVEAGPPLDPEAAGEDRGLVVACFSGGRDSLAQAALLQELGETPVLVSTVAARSGSDEPDHPRRTRAMREIRTRRGLELVEVRSDLRACFENGFAGERYGLAVTELTDTFLFFAAAFVVALARGAREVCLAAEAELHHTAPYAGTVVQHRHAMYSGVTQRVLSALFATTGITHGGLTAPLRQFQVQRLLSARYPDVRDLQHSCWSQTLDEAACSRCGECRTNGLNLVADGVPPATAGIDLVTLLGAHEGWRPRLHEREATLPHSRWASDAQTLRCLQRIPVARMAQALEVQAADEGRRAEAVQAYARLRTGALSVVPEPDPEPGYRAAFLDLYPARRRAALARILDEHFAADDGPGQAADLRRGRLLSDWITAPLSALPVRTPVTPGDGVTRAARSHPPSPVPPPESVLAPIRALIPDPEPTLARPADGAGILPVAETVLDGNERAYVLQCVDTNWISSAGSFVRRFEEAFAAEAGCAYAVSCSSGTTALHLALAAAGLGPGDEVIVPAFTMIASANAVGYVGATAVLVDTDPVTWNLDLEQVRERIGPRTRAIMVMHTYGQPVDMDGVHALARANDLLVIEDAAEAHGARFAGRRVGSLGDVAAFSFYGNKIITTGEGGMVTTNDPQIAAIARELRDHAFSPDRHFWHRFRAFNYRMSNLQAAVGLAQTERLDELVAARRRIAALYADGLRDVPGIELPPALPGRESVHWVHGMVFGPSSGTARDPLRRHLAARGIETRTFFVPLHLQPAYLADHARRRHPVAERLGATGLYLPSSPALTDDDVERVVDAVREACTAAPVLRGSSAG